MSDTLIRVEGLYKKFCRSLKRSMVYGTMDSTRSMLGIPYDATQLRTGEFWALQDINFELKRGETLGLIGQNGCGKSTLLRLLNGIFPPDKGHIEIRGRIGALIAVGAGFHPQMSGRENIYLNGTILGMTRQEIKRKFDEIVDFAEIGDFLDAPVATYSSGMTVRLGFSIAVQGNVDIILADEILAVGDLAFQTKCFNKIGILQRQGVSTILVSHNTHNIMAYTSNCVLLSKGQLIEYNETDKVIQTYHQYLADGTEEHSSINKVLTGTNLLTVKKVSFYPELNKDDLIKIKSGDDLIMKIELMSEKFFSEIEIDTVLNIPWPTPLKFFQNSTKVTKEITNIPIGISTLEIKVKNIFVQNIKLNWSVDIWEKNRLQRLFYWRQIPIQVDAINASIGWNNYNCEFSIT
jgi:lipopolysaccharide transport system ATP-binding protein